VKDLKEIYECLETNGNLTLHSIEETIKDSDINYIVARCEDSVVYFDHFENREFENEGKFVVMKECICFTDIHVAYFETILVPVQRILDISFTR